MTDRLIRIKDYEQAADEKVSIGGIKWQRKWDVCIQCDSREEAEALRARLAQPEPEPVFAFRRKGLDDFCTCSEDRYNELAQKPNLFEVKKFYTAPLQHEWQGLTDEEIKDYWITCMWKIEGTSLPIPEFARAIEAKLKAKNV